VEQRHRLKPRKNPYFEHADTAFFIAERQGKPVGRISAQVCELVQKFQVRGTGHFGLFECEDSQETAEGLIHAAESWLQLKGMTNMMGPFNLSINDEIGLLVEGFHRPPFVLMGHHRPYYNMLMHHAGLRKEMDVYAYYLDITRPYTERIQRIMHWAIRDPGIRVRRIGGRSFRREMLAVLDLFKDAWSDNWGYVPPTQPEVDHLIHMLRHLLDRGVVLLSEVEGEAAGFMVVLPNLNEMIGDLDGKLFPAGWLRLLWRLKYARFPTVRVPLMGLRKKYQRSRKAAAIAFSMIDQCRQYFLPKGVTHCEMSWILEENGPMRKILEAADMTRDKVYRIYSKPL
jgi:hypothetical protein